MWSPITKNDWTPVLHQTVGHLDFIQLPVGTSGEVDSPNDKCQTHFTQAKPWPILTSCP